MKRTQKRSFAKSFRVVCLLGILAFMDCWPLSAGESKVPFSTGLKQIPKENVTQALVDSKFQKCDQACYYQRAIDNLSLQLQTYLIKQSHLLDQNYPENSKRILMGNFCDVAGKNDIDECVQDYTEANKWWVIKMKKALKDNEQAKLLYLCSKNPDNQECHSSRFSADLNQELKAGEEQPQIYNTYITKSSQMEDVRNNFEKLKEVADKSSNEDFFKNIINENETITAYQPREEDFFDFKKDKDGVEVPVPNKTLFQKAKADWDQLMNQFGDQGTQKRLAELRKQNAEEFKKQFSKGGNGVLRENFSEAQEDYADQFNSNQEKLKQQESKKDQKNTDGKNGDQNQPANQTNQGQLSTDSQRKKPEITGEKEAKPRANSTGTTMSHTSKSIKVHEDPPPPNTAPSPFDVYLKDQ